MHSSSLKHVCSVVWSVAGSRLVVTGGWKDKASMTLMAGGSATGVYTQPHFMFGGGGWSDNIAAGADPGSCVLVKPDSHMMTGEAFAELLPMVADNIPGGVSPTNRCLLILDSHDLSWSTNDSPPRCIRFPSVWVLSARILPR